MPIHPDHPRPADERPTATVGALDLACTTRGHGLTVRAAGEIDIHTVGPLRVMLTAAAVYGYTSLHLDTSAVGFADSAFLDVLEAWRRDGRTLTLGATSRPVQLLLDVAAATRRSAPGEGLKQQAAR